MSRATWSECSPAQLTRPRVCTEPAVDSTTTSPPLRRTAVTRAPVMISPPRPVTSLAMVSATCT